MLWKGGGGANLLIILVKFIDNIRIKVYWQKSISAEKRMAEKRMVEKRMVEKRFGRKALGRKAFR